MTQSDQLRAALRDMLTTWRTERGGQPTSDELLRELSDRRIEASSSEVVQALCAEYQVDLPKEALTLDALLLILPL